MTKKEMLHEMFLNTEYEKNIERMAKKPKKYILRVYLEWLVDLGVNLAFYNALLTKEKTAIMKTNLKKMEMGKTFTTFKVEHSNSDRSEFVENELIAIAILLGGYNEFGRKVDLQKYREVKEEFDSCIEDMRRLLTE